MQLPVVLAVWLFVAGVSGIVVTPHQDHFTESHHEGSPFERILEHLHGEASVSMITPWSLDVLIDELFLTFGCNDTAPGYCECLSSAPLLDIIGANSSDGLREKRAGKASVVILYHLIDAPSNCQPNSTDNYHSNYITRMLGNYSAEEDARHHLEERLELLLSQLEGKVESHEHESHEEEEDHMSNEGGDNHIGHEEEEDRMSHEEGDNHMGNEEEEDHMSHEEKGDDHMTNTECFDAHGVLAEVRDDSLEDMAEQSALVIIDFLVQGHHPQSHCSRDGQPTPEDFVNSLYAQLGLEPRQTFGIEEFELLMTKLNIGSHDDHEDEDEAEGNDDHTHDERKRRSVSSWPDSGESRTRVKRAVDTQNSTQSPNVSQACYSAEELLTIYGVSHSDDISQRELEMICPSLLQQFVSGACAEKQNELPGLLVSDAERYGYGFLAVLLISLCAVIGVVFAPCFSSPGFQHLMSFMVSLAVGTLTSDALLHLLPQAFELHAHAGDEHGHEDEGFRIEVEPYTYKSLVVIAAIYAFFILESLLEMGRKGVGHSHSHAFEREVESAELNEHKINGGFSGEPTRSGLNNGGISSQNLTKYTESTDSLSTVVQETSGCCGVRSVGWMVIIGDAIHNFADGLAIGAAFSLSVPGGISTSLAVLCHELPHELGDFAILLNAGMSVKRAALFNFLSAAMAFGGLFVSLALASDGDAQVWIFTVAAGMFLYIALADMIPEMLSMQKKGPRFRAFLLQNIGFLIGVGILVIIGLFEDRIKV